MLAQSTSNSVHEIHGNFGRRLQSTQFVEFMGPQMGFPPRFVRKAANHTYLHEIISMFALVSTSPVLNELASALRHQGHPCMSKFAYS